MTSLQFLYCAPKEGKTTNFTSDCTFSAESSCNCSLYVLWQNTSTCCCERKKWLTLERSNRFCNQFYILVNDWFMQEQNSHGRAERGWKLRYTSKLIHYHYNLKIKLLKDSHVSDMCWHCRHLIFFIPTNTDTVVKNWKVPYVVKSSDKGVTFYKVSHRIQLTFFYLCWYTLNSRAFLSVLFRNWKIMFCGSISEVWSYWLNLQDWTIEDRSHNCFKDPETFHHLLTLWWGWNLDFMEVCIGADYLQILNSASLPTMQRQSLYFCTVAK